MNSRTIILRDTTHAHLTNKGSELTWAELDANQAAIYDDLEAMRTNANIPAYDGATTYDNTKIKYVKYDSLVWKYISVTPASGITPVEGADWTEIQLTDLIEPYPVKNGDNIITATGTVNALIVSVVPLVPTNKRFCILVKAIGANTVINPTIAINNIPAITITKEGGVNLSVEDITGAGHVLILLVDPVANTCEYLNAKTSKITFDNGAGSWGHVKINSVKNEIKHTDNIIIDAPIIEVPQLTVDTMVKINILGELVSCSISESSIATKAYAESLVVGLWDDRGNYSLLPSSVNDYPSTGGSGTAGAILKGDIWTISGLGSGNTCLIGTTQIVQDGDTVRAIINTPGNTDANWACAENNIGYVPENKANKTGTITGNESSTSLYSTIKGLVDWILYDLKAFLVSKTTPVDADTVLITDSADSDTTKKTTWANIKATLKTYFDTLYQPSGSYLTTETDPVFIAAKDTDGTLSVNSDSKWATQKATKSYCDTKLAINRFGANIQSSAVDITLTNPMVNIQNITMTVGGKKVFLPAMNAANSFEIGREINFKNSGSITYTVYANDTTTLLATVASGQSARLQLVDNSTANGSFNYRLLSTITGLEIGSTSGTIAAGNDSRFYQNRLNDFRLTLVSAVSVPTSDITYAAEQTIYCTPAIGNSISLFDGSNWVTYISDEFSVALGTLTNNIGYDVFCYANAGVPTLELLAWTSGTVRATALVYEKGILCKSGDLTRRYLGSFYNPGNKSATATMTIATPCVVTYTSHGLMLNAPVVFTTTGALPTGITSGTTYYVAGTITANTFNVSATPGGAVINTTGSQSGIHTCTIPTYTEDSNSNRLLFNYNNSFPRPMYYSYSAIAAYTAGVQIWNASLSGKLCFFLGISNSPCTFEATCGRSNSTAGIISTIGVGDGVTNAFATDYQNQTYHQGAANANGITTSHYGKFFPVGFNWVAPLQSSTATGTCSWATNGNKFEGNIFS